jgi:hypothetical protein
MFAAVCMPLSFMGYNLPADFVDRLREASGVPRNKATATVDTQRALKQLIPGCEIEYGGMRDDHMLELLADQKVIVRVMLKVAKLPLHSPTHKHFKPDTAGGHAVSLARADRKPGGNFDVLWMDPMGRPVNNYHGIMVPFSDIEPALMRTDTGKIRVTTGWRDAAMREKSDEVDRTRMRAGNPTIIPARGQVNDPDDLVLSRGRDNEFAQIPVGTPFLHPVTRELVTHATETADFRLAGRSTDGKFAGVWVLTRKVKDSRGATLLVVDRQLIGVPFAKPE